MNVNRTIIWSVFLTATLGSWAHVEAQNGSAAPPTIDHVLRVEHAAVVSVSAPASRTGRDILQRGGNAVDAAVATAFALAVTYPPAGNIGGGGFMMVLPGPHQQPVCVDYRETAPHAARATTFTLEDSHLDARMVGVPGTVRGLELAHRRYGKLSWRELVAPAIHLARDGFEMDAYVARSLNAIRKDDRSRDYAELQRVYSPAVGDRWHAGDRLVQLDLAETLKLIAEQGGVGFYEGPTALAIAREMAIRGGLITAEDLKAYTAKLRKPVHGTYRGADIYGPPPPSSGGVALVEMLNLLEPFELSKSDHFSTRSVHLMIESMRRAYADRARYLGDTDFVEIPSHLTSKDYARRLAASINLKRATPSESLAPEIQLAGEGESTTHFSVVDANGMAVSNTYTLEQSYGSRIVVKGCGFLLNNEMGDFNRVAGHTDREGRIGTEANLIAPGKRMLSSQTPVLVTRNGHIVLITGSPGGRTIINTVLCVVLNVLEYGMDLPAAVAAPRLHHGWFPDTVRFEKVESAAQSNLTDRLREMGHVIARTVSVQGDAHSIHVDLESGQITAVADDRLSGCAAGF